MCISISSDRMNHAILVKSISLTTGEDIDDTTVVDETVGETRPLCPQAHVGSSEESCPSDNADLELKDTGPLDISLGGTCDLLAQWFEVHFKLLHNAGSLGTSLPHAAPEAGCLPPGFIVSSVAGQVVEAVSEPVADVAQDPPAVASEKPLVKDHYTPWIPRQETHDAENSNRSDDNSCRQYDSVESARTAHRGKALAKGSEIMYVCDRGTCPMSSFHSSQKRPAAATATPAAEAAIRTGVTGGANKVHVEVRPAVTGTSNDPANTKLSPVHPVTQGRKKVVEGAAEVSSEVTAKSGNKGKVPVEAGQGRSTALGMTNVCEASSQEHSGDATQVPPPASTGMERATASAQNQISGNDSGDDEALVLQRSGFAKSKSSNKRARVILAMEDDDASPLQSPSAKHQATTRPAPISSAAFMNDGANSTPEAAVASVARSAPSAKPQSTVRPAPLSNAAVSHDGISSAPEAAPASMARSAPHPTAGRLSFPPSAPHKAAEPNGSIPQKRNGSVSTQPTRTEGHTTHSLHSLHSSTNAPLRPSTSTPPLPSSSSRPPVPQSAKTSGSGLKAHGHIPFPSVRTDSSHVLATPSSSHSDSMSRVPPKPPMGSHEGKGKGASHSDDPKKLKLGSGSSTDTNLGSALNNKKENKGLNVNLLKFSSYSLTPMDLEL